MLNNKIGFTNKPNYMVYKDKSREFTRRNQAEYTRNTSDVSAQRELVETNRIVDDVSLAPVSIHKVPVSEAITTAQGQLRHYDENKRRHSTMTSQINNNSFHFQNYRESVNGSVMSDQLKKPVLPTLDISNTKMGISLSRDSMTKEDLAFIYEASSKTYSDKTIKADLLRIEQYRKFVKLFYDTEAMFPLNPDILTSFMRYLGKLFS